MVRYASIASFALATIATSTPAPFHNIHLNHDYNVSLPLFAELEELSRIVDISYCVGMTGISYPFQCANRCDEFPDFELVDTFNTGPLMSDSCGYIALDHSPRRVGTGRIIVAFRGTYSLANTIADLSTVPQEYVPYPGEPGKGTKTGDKDGEDGRNRWWKWRPWHLKTEIVISTRDKPITRQCTNCTVHTGFWSSWQNTRPFVVPHLEAMKNKYPEYRLDLVGHSLGGAVSALAGLEFEALGWEPHITTFGEPRVGNFGLRNYVDQTFNLPSEHVKSMGSLNDGRYRRVTHVDDPVPLLPLQEWGYRAHAGEIHISKPELQPSILDIRLCYGDEDLNCIAGAHAGEEWFNAAQNLDLENGDEQDENLDLHRRWGLPIPSRYKMWQLFFAHRDYFWRLGLCVPGGDPFDWGRERYDFGNHDDMPQAKRKEDL